MLSLPSFSEDRAPRPPATAGEAAGVKLDHMNARMAAVTIMCIMSAGSGPSPLISTAQRPQSNMLHAEALQTHLT